MYKPKPTFACDMPNCSASKSPAEAGKPIRVLVLNASLKHKTDPAEAPSNTEEVAQLVLDEMKVLETEGGVGAGAAGASGGISTEIIRLADKNIPVGLKFKENDQDEWPEIAMKLREADIVIFATPIWWGGRSSLMQRVIERLDAFDEEYISEGRSAFYNKVAGIVVTGSEDGALSVMGTIMMVLTWMGFTLPPECAAYWIGEVGQPTSTDRERRLQNKATPHMAKNMARNLLYYAHLLKQHPLEAKE